MRQTKELQYRALDLFFASGIRPKHALVVMKIAVEKRVQLAFRKIRWWKRCQSMIAGMLRVKPKPLTVKAKIPLWGWVNWRDKSGRWTRYRSDYDPTFYRRNGRVLTDPEALAINAEINARIGHPEIQHGTHVTMDQAGVSRHLIEAIGPPGDSIVITPIGEDVEIHSVRDDQMRVDLAIQWHWPGVE